MPTEILTGPATFQSLPPLNLQTCSKTDIKEYFLNSYSLSESLFLGLKDESVFLAQPDRLRLPLIFYYGHTAGVYMNKLILAGLIKPEDRIDKHIETLLETGVDEMSWDDLVHDEYRMGGKVRWPRLSEVVDYRRNVKAFVLKVIDDTPLDLPITKENPWWALLMGMEHERLHLETSSVLIRQLPIDMVTLPEGWVHGPPTYGEGVKGNDLVTVEEMTVTLGKPEDDPHYGWDNEYGSKTLRVPPFEASRYLVTNSEFLEFVKAQGYERREFWSEEGWQWRAFIGAKHPLFWVCSKDCKSGCGGDMQYHTHCKENGVTNGITNGNGHPEYDMNSDDRYRFRCVFSELTMPWDWPVEVNYHEAKAFCRWKGDHFRLATEAELAAMGDMPVRGGAARCVQHINGNSQKQGTDSSVNNNLRHGSSTPVNMFPPSRRGFHDLQGNVWEWLEDHYNGFPPADTHYLYDDFSTSSYDGRHNVILGGSWVTTGGAISHYFRVGFRRHFYQHAGFRLVRSLPKKRQERTYIPATQITTPLYLQGVGVQDIPTPPMDPTQYTFQCEPSTNRQIALETAEVLNIALAEEFGNGRGFQILLANRCEAAIEKFEISRGKAFHLGCGTGFLATLLARWFNTTFASDVLGRFIDTCLRLAQGKEVVFTEDGEEKSARFDDDVSCRDITFKQLTWLPQEVESSDFILVTNLRHYNNAKPWLVRMPELVLPGGLLVILCTDTCKLSDLTALYKGRFTLVQQEDLSDPVGTQGHKATLTFWRPFNTQ